MDVMNPQLIEALRQINDDPTYLNQGDGELVDLSVCLLFIIISMMRFSD